jgi:hypothetical protein
LLVDPDQLQVLFHRLAINRSRPSDLTSELLCGHSARDC